MSSTKSEHDEHEIRAETTAKASTAIEAPQPICLRPFNGSKPRFLLASVNAYQCRTLGRSVFQAVATNRAEHVVSLPYPSSDRPDTTLAFS